MSLRFTIFSIILQKQLVKEIGLYEEHSWGSFPGFNMGITIAILQESGKNIIFP